jgi:short-subunit dehydrogenase
MLNYTMITGASEGLGKALAIECARRNMNLILVSLPGIELYQLASYIRKRYKVKVCEYETDISQEYNCLELYNTIKQHHLPVNMLINNAGIGGTRQFDKTDFVVWQRHIQVNITGMVLLTHLLLPELKRHPHSHILNVSSLAVFFYLPGKQVYGATKSFIYFFSRSLRRELKNEGIQVSVLCPGGINSNPSQYLMNYRSKWIAKSSFMLPDTVARIAVHEMLQGKETIIPGKWNNLFIYLDRILPAFVKEKLIRHQAVNFQQQYVEALMQGNLTADKKTA